MFTKSKLSLIALLISTSMKAYSPTSSSCEYLSDEVSVQEERYQALEHYLEHDASDEVKKMVRVLEQDTFKIMHLYGELVESIVIKTRPIIENACTTSAIPLLSIAGGMGTLFYEIHVTSQKYFFIEEERDVMQQRPLEEFVTYTKNRLEQFYAYIDILSGQHEGRRNLCELSIDSDLKKSLSDRFNNVLVNTDIYSQQIVKTMLAEISNEVPHLRQRYNEFLNDVLELRQLVNCDATAFVDFVEERLDRVGAKLATTLFYKDAAYQKYFEPKTYETLSPEDVPFLLEIVLKNAARCKETAIEEYRKRN